MQNVKNKSSIKQEDNEEASNNAEAKPPVDTKHNDDFGDTGEVSANADAKASDETRHDVGSRGDGKAQDCIVTKETQSIAPAPQGSSIDRSNIASDPSACGLLILLAILDIVIICFLLRMEKNINSIKNLLSESGGEPSALHDTSRQLSFQDNSKEEADMEHESISKMDSDDEPSLPPVVQKPVKSLPGISVQMHLETKIMALLENAGQNKFSIAEEFAEWAKNKPDGESLLIIPEVYDDFWFIGDVHGCSYSIEKLITYIEMQAKPNRRQNVIFLGDLLDRGEDSWGVAAMVQKLMLLNSDPDFEKRWRFVFTKGNHDVGFSIKNGEFKSTVSPAESVNELNKWDISDADKMKLATAYVELVRISPCMGEICDEKRGNQTIVFCHGGVPHVDLQEELISRAFSDEHQHEVEPGKLPYHRRTLMQCVPSDMREKISKDFIWLRLSAMPKKRPNRGNSGCEMGYEDVCDYCKLHQELTGRHITHIIRGHDHETEGYKLNSYHEELNPKAKYKEPCILTINAMEPDMSSSGIFRNRDLALAHWSMDSALVFHLFPTRHL